MTGYYRRGSPLVTDDILLPRPREFRGIRPRIWNFAELFGGQEWGFIAELLLRFAIHRNTGWEPVTVEELHSYTRVPASVIRSFSFHLFPSSKSNGKSGRAVEQVLFHFTAEAVQMMHRQIVGRGAKVHVLPKPSCIALDYDFTVARFHGGFHGLHNLLAAHAQMPIELARAAHQQAETRGFTPEQLLTCAKELGHDFGPAKRNEFLNAFNQWLRSSLHLYQEADEAAKRWTDVPVHIVSFGNSEYQQAKINTLCVPHIEAHIVQDSKVTMLRELHARYGGPIWFFDDNSDEHDALRNSVMTDEQVLCLLVTRRESPHYNKRATYLHRRITSLLDAHWE